jgi:hypothetical protein
VVGPGAEAEAAGLDCEGGTTGERHGVKLLKRAYKLEVGSGVSQVLTELGEKDIHSRGIVSAMDID